MAIYCRVSGEKLELKDVEALPSGIYCENDQVIFDSGCLANQQHHLAELLDVTFAAIEFIHNDAKSADITTFSHLLPPQIESYIAPTALDKALIKAMEYGVLQSINQNPRMSMRYDVDLLPTSRVKKTAANYQAHLVAHSDCWQQRTLTGIVPKKLLAKVSEDELNIYENVVYARLIDNVLFYLAGKQKQTEKILELLEKFQQLDTGEMDHRYIHSITSDWGRAFDDSTSGQSKNNHSLEKTSQQQLTFTQSIALKLQQLKNNPLYRYIPPNLDVAISLKSTNILLHDNHYRRMAELWRAWAKQTATKRLTPEQIHKIKQQRFTAYSQYCDRVLKQIFNDLNWQVEGDKLQITKGLELTLDGSKSGVWRISHQTDSIVNFVAISEVVDIEQIELSNNNTVLLMPLLASNDSHQQHQQVIELSPLLLECKEQLALRLIKAIWRWALKCYQQPVDKKYLRFSKSLNDTINQNGVLYRTISEETWQAFTEKSNNEVQGVIQHKLHIVNFIHSCPVCGENHDNQKSNQQSNLSFKSQCSNNQCKAVWTFDKSNFHVNKDKPVAGRFVFSLSLN